MNVAYDPLNLLSICSGVGGLDLGVELALPGARVVCCVEREGFCAEVLAARGEEEGVAPAPVWSDLRTFDGRRWRGAVDILTAGYPCQPFSLAGRRRGSADPRHLWPHVARIIGEAAPPIVFLENVSGHVDLGFDQVVRELEGLGYRVEAGLFSAREVGASHRRLRLFILGVADAQRPDQGGGEPGGQGGTGIGRCGSANDGGRVADAGGARSQGRERGGALRSVNGIEASRSAPELRELPLFAPGPGDYAAWIERLSISPHHAPALSRAQDFTLAAVDCGLLDAEEVGRAILDGKDARWLGKAIARAVAQTGRRAEAQSQLRRDPHGLSDRVDRLRALGNAVCPLQAAYAFCALWALLREGE
ncbi:MAG: DNA cytosine methyltransferase [Phycisphaeraceae bacterium]|nr:MAG: DNA cytosine methyltransferase [Phycisphaeraceae bacterium]